MPYCLPKSVQRMQSSVCLTIRWFDVYHTVVYQNTLMFIILYWLQVWLSTYGRFAHWPEAVWDPSIAQLLSFVADQAYLAVQKQLCEPFIEKYINTVWLIGTILVGRQYPSDRPSDKLPGFPCCISHGLNDSKPEQVEPATTWNKHWRNS